MRPQNFIDHAAAFAQYAALRGAFGALHMFPAAQNMRTAAQFGSLYGRLVPRHRERARGHIRRSFPELDERAVAKLADDCQRSLFQMFMVEATAVPRLLTPTSWPQHVRTGKIESSLRLLVGNDPVIFVTGHCGNWELLGFTLALLGFRLHALARPLDNPWLDRWVRGVREARGLTVLTKWGATSEVQRIIESGGRVGFIADQNAGEDGMFVPFFGRLASSYKSIGLLAMRYEVPIAVGAARRIGGRFDYELDGVDVIRPNEWRDQPDPLFYITARFNRAIELAVRRAPDQYLWMHRRWKSRPAHERAGKPMPERLREKLQNLPWMGESELARLEQRIEPLTCS